MTLRMEEICEVRPPLSGELQSRADRTPWTEKRRQFIVYRGDDQVGFLSFDLGFEEGLVIYELFVGERHGRQGIGTAMLLEAEKIALSLGYAQLVLRPEVLNGRLSGEELTCFYLKREFRRSATYEGLLEKSLIDLDCSGEIRYGQSRRFCSHGLIERMERA